MLQRLTWQKEKETASTSGTHKGNVVTELLRSPVIDMFSIEILDLEETGSKSIKDQSNCKECQTPILAGAYSDLSLSSDSNCNRYLGGQEDSKWCYQIFKNTGNTRVSFLVDVKLQTQFSHGKAMILTIMLILFSTLHGAVFTLPIRCSARNTEGLWQSKQDQDESGE